MACAAGHSKRGLDVGSRRVSVGGGVDAAGAVDAVGHAVGQLALVVHAALAAAGVAGPSVGAVEAERALLLVRVTVRVRARVRVRVRVRVRLRVKGFG